jgi:hypothetical protein
MPTHRTEEGHAVSVSYFRSHLREALDSEHPTVIHDFQQPKAIVITLGPHATWYKSERDSHCRKARADLAYSLEIIFGHGH